MRHPACEEDPGRRAAGRDAGIHAHVVDGHQHHHGAADDVERREARRALDDVDLMSSHNDLARRYRSPIATLR